MEPISAEFLHSKFCATPDVFEGKFGSICDYLLGLDYFIGMPNPNVASAIENEHLYAEDSQVPFYLNSLVCTPAQEYEFVVRPKTGHSYPGVNSDTNPRDIQDLGDFLSHENFIRAKLLREELIALRLYTGPMFCKYNAVLRKFPKETFDGLHGNGYTTTIHAIVSGIIKLSQIMVLPTSRKVYRGVSGMTLPPHFWESDDYGCRGGVDYGILSTTKNKDIALEYCSKSKSNSKTLFEIEIGQVNKGADLTWVSQYPREAEILMPPLSNLEVIGSSSVVESNNNQTQEESANNNTNDDKEWIIVVPMRLDINTKSRTIEELIATRKVLHIATFENLLQEAKRELKEIFVASESDKYIRHYLKTLETHLDDDKSHSAEWFNDNKNYRLAQNKMLDIKEQVVQKAGVVTFARRLLTGYGLHYYLERSNTRSGGNLDDRAMKVHALRTKEAQIGARIAEREEVAMATIKALLTAEIGKVRSSLESDLLTQLVLEEDDYILESVCTTSLLRFDTNENRCYMSGSNGMDSATDDLCAKEFQKAREKMSGRISDENSLVGENGYWKYATQQSPYDKVLLASQTLHPPMKEAVHMLNCIGYYGENCAEDERYSQLLKEKFGKLVTDVLRDADITSCEILPAQRQTRIRDMVTALVACSCDSDTGGNSTQVEPVLLGTSNKLSHVKHLQQAAEALLLQSEQHQLEIAAALDGRVVNDDDIVIAFAEDCSLQEQNHQAASSTTTSSPPSPHSTDIRKKSLLQLLCADILWTCQVYKFLRTDPDFSRLRILERRLRWGRGGLGRGQTPCIRNAIINPLEDTPTSYFTSTHFLDRVYAAIKLVSSIGSNSNIPWLCAFDEHVACLDMYTLARLEIDEEEHDENFRRFGGLSSIVNYQGKSIYGGSRGQIKSTYNHSAFLLSGPQDEYRFVKEAYYEHYQSKNSKDRDRNRDKGEGEDSLQEAMADDFLQRVSVERLLEITGGGFGCSVGGVSAVKDIKSSTTLFGTGGQELGSLDVLQLRKTAGEADFNRSAANMRQFVQIQELCWVGVVSVFAERFDDLSLAVFDLPENEGSIESVILTKHLTVPQTYVIAGILESSKDNIKLHIESNTTAPLLPQDWRSLLRNTPAQGHTFYANFYKEEDGGDDPSFPSHRHGLDSDIDHMSETTEHVTSVATNCQMGSADRGEVGGGGEGGGTLTSTPTRTDLSSTVYASGDFSAMQMGLLIGHVVLSSIGNSFISRDNGSDVRDNKCEDLSESSYNSVSTVFFRNIKNLLSSDNAVCHMWTLLYCVPRVDTVTLHNCHLHGDDLLLLSRMIRGLCPNLELLEINHHKKQDRIGGGENTESDLRPPTDLRRLLNQVQHIQFGSYRGLNLCSENTCAGETELEPNTSEVNGNGHVQSLDLFGNCMRVEHLYPVIKHFSGQVPNWLLNIRILNLENNCMDHTIMVFIKGILCYPQGCLAELNLSNNKIVLKREAAQLLADGISASQSLTSLKLSHNNFSSKRCHEGLKILGTAVGSSSSLVSFDLSRTLIDDRGCSSFFEGFQSITTTSYSVLAELRLSKNRIRSLGLISLARTVMAVDLKILDICENPIGHIGVAHLSKTILRLNRIKVLDISKFKFSREKDNRDRRNGNRDNDDDDDDHEDISTDSTDNSDGVDIDPNSDDSSSNSNSDSSSNSDSNSSSSNSVGNNSSSNEDHDGGEEEDDVTKSPDYYIEKEFYDSCDEDWGDDECEAHHHRDNGQELSNIEKSKSSYEMLSSSLGAMLSLTSLNVSGYTLSGEAACSVLSCPALCTFTNRKGKMDFANCREDGSVNDFRPDASDCRTQTHVQPPQALAISLNLTKLDLEGTVLGDCNAIILLSAISERCSVSLTSLNLRDTKLQHCGTAMAQCMRTCQSLQKLVLSQNYFKDDGIPAITAALAWTSSLEAFGFSLHKLTGAGVVALLQKGIAKCPSLRWLKILINENSKEEVQALLSVLASISVSVCTTSTATATTSSSCSNNSNGNSRIFSLEYIQITGVTKDSAAGNQFQLMAEKKGFGLRLAASHV